MQESPCVRCGRHGGCLIKCKIYVKWREKLQEYHRRMRRMREE